jgi:hypothetical protein
MFWRNGDWHLLKPSLFRGPNKKKQRMYKDLKTESGGGIISLLIFY